MAKKLQTIEAKDLLGGDELVTGGTVLKLRDVWMQDSDVWFTFKMGACDGRVYDHKCKMRALDKAQVLR